MRAQYPTSILFRLSQSHTRLSENIPQIFVCVFFVGEYCLYSRRVLGKSDLFHWPSWLKVQLPGITFNRSLIGREKLSVIIPTVALQEQNIDSEESSFRLSAPISNQDKFSAVIILEMTSPPRSVTQARDMQQRKSVLFRSFPVQINTGDKVTFLWSQAVH